MLVVSIILEAAVAVIAAFAALAGRPYLSLLHLHGLCALRPRALATMAGLGAAVVGTVLAGDHHGAGCGMGAVSGRAREVASGAAKPEKESDRYGRW